MTSARIATVLLALAATAEVVYGVAAIGGNGRLKANVREIESAQHFGNLYLSLGAWGVILVLIGLAGLWSAWALAGGRPHARLYSLGATLFGLAAALLTLAIFHGAALVPLIALFVALYLLSYRVAE